MEKIAKIILLLFVILLSLIIIVRILGLVNRVSNPGRTDTEVSAFSAFSEESDSNGISFRHTLTEEEINNIIARCDFRSDMYIYYQALEPEEKKAYCLIYDCVSRADSEVLWGDRVDITEDKVMDVVNSVYLDHPELFWMENGASYSFGPRNKKVMTVKPRYNDLINNLETNKTVFNTNCNTILSEARQHASEGIIYQEAIIHDRLCEGCVYNLDAPNNQSAYSCIVGGSTVCSGYARAFQYLMRELGVPTYYVMGQSLLSDDNGAHAWNIVMLNGNAYDVDVTWDDVLWDDMGAPAHAYFNVTDSRISSTHSRDEISNLLPDCVSDDLSYDKVIGDTIMIEDINWR